MAETLELEEEERKEKCSLMEKIARTESLSGILTRKTFTIILEC